MLTQLGKIVYEDEKFVVYQKTKAANILCGEYKIKERLYIIINKQNGKKYKFFAETE